VNAPPTPTPAAGPALDSVNRKYAGPVDTGLGPFVNAAVVALSDTTDLPYVTMALWVGTGGDVAVIFSGAPSGITIHAVPSGTLLPIRVSRVAATGTSASNIIALW